MNDITIDSDICSNCGICVNECPTFVFTKYKNVPQIAAPEYCISCGHCVLACPNMAINNKKAPISKQTTIHKPSFNEEDAELFLRSRRSIRNFRNISIQREQLLKLVNIAHFAPTRSNLQGVSYVIVDNKEIIKKAVETEIKWMEGDSLLNKQFAHFIKIYRENHLDSILHNAPAIILATAAKDFIWGRENSILSLAYLELYAPSIGLGSCWAGIFERCALNDNSPMIDVFKIPEDKKITGAVMIGYPQFSYKRMVDRNPLDATFL